MRAFVHSLRARLLSLVLLAALPAFFAAVTQGIQTRRNAGQFAQASAMQVVHLAASEQAHLVDTTRQLLATLAQLPQAAAPEIPACRALLSDLLQRFPSYVNLAVVSPDGVELCSGAPLAQTTRPADRAWYRRAMQSRAFVVSEYLVDNPSGVASIVCALPVLDDEGQVRLILTASLDLRWVDQALSTTSLPTGGVLTVVDTQGTVLARYPHSDGFVGTVAENPLVQKVLSAATEGTTEAAGLDGVRRLYAFAPLRANVPIAYVFVGIPAATAYAAANHELLRDLALGVYITLLGLLAAWLSVQPLILDQIRSLGAAARRLAAGDLSARAVVSRGATEIRQLALDFDRMAATNQARTLELEASRERYRTLVEASPDAIVTANLQGIITMANHQAVALYGAADLSELLGRHTLEFIAPEDHPRATENFALALQSDAIHDITFTLIHRDGSHYPGELSVAAVRDPAGQPTALIALLRDTSSRSQAQEALRASEARYRSLVDALPDSVALCDLAGRVLLVNEQGALQHGYADPKDMVDTSLFDLVSPADRPLALEHARRFVQQKVVRGLAWTVRRRDGTVYPAEVSAAQVQDASGAPQALVVVTRDETDRKRLEGQLLLAQKMEVVGRLSAGIAHDFNNILAVIQGFGELVARALPAGSIASGDIQEVLDAARRGAVLTRQLLAFSRTQVLDMRVQDPRQVVLGLAKLLKRLIGEDIEFVTTLATDLWPVRADAGQLEQVLLNLALNARDAMPDGGRLTIAAANAVLVACSPRTLGAPDGDYAMLSIVDTGCGMSPEVLRHVFEPFFTTKEVGHGTGLGLATVHGIIQQHGGDISLSSAVGVGTEFRIFLPRALETPTAPAAQAAEFAPDDGSETILVAEDDDSVRALLVRSLTAAGYDVLAAADGDEALRVASQQPGPIRLLITDLVMSHMGGLVLARRLRDLRPALKVLYVSGHIAEALARHDLESGAAFLPKPFGEGDLRRRVRALLDSA
jgi:PAS domain S-box-containing protein